MRNDKDPEASGDGRDLDQDAVLDVGDTLCGELALLLRAELGSMQPGQVLRVVARDPAAPQDLPAWCEVTGHTLLREAHPHYWIRRRPA